MDIGAQRFWLYISVVVGLSFLLAIPFETGRFSAGPIGPYASAYDAWIETRTLNARIDEAVAKIVASGQRAAATDAYDLMRARLESEKLQGQARKAVLGVVILRAPMVILFWLAGALPIWLLTRTRRAPPLAAPPRRTPVIHRRAE